MAGGKVVISEGTFDITAALTLGNDVHLQGQGRSSVLKLGASADVDVINNADRTSGNNGIIISDLAIDGNRSNNNNTKTGVDITHSESTTTSRHHVYNCYIKGFGKEGIKFSRISGGLITNNFVSDISGNDAFAIVIQTGDYNTVIGNIIDTIAGSGGCGVLAADDDHSVIIGNTVRTTVDGIRWFSASGAGEIKYSTCHGNIIDTATGVGISIQHIYYFSVVGNFIKNTTSHGIEGFANPRYGVVAGNTIEDAGDVGIFQTGAWVTVANNTIQASIKDGIAASSHQSISGNVIHNAGHSGIVVAGARNDGSITGNYIYNPGLTGSASGDEEGIALIGTGGNSSDRWTITGNTLRDDQGSPTMEEGIQLFSAADDNIVEGNSISGANTAPIADAGTGNIIRNNRGFVTENSGTATLANGNTTIAVTHGLAVTPAAGDIMIVPIENWGSMTQWRIDTYTSTQFTITADQDPGEDVDFAWKAIVL